MPERTPLVLTFLGSGNAFAPGRLWSGFLVNRRYQFDAPPTLLAQLRLLDLDPAAIDAVFISHFHGDHFFGLPFLLLDYVYVTQRRSDLTIVGPPGTEDALRTVMEVGYPGAIDRDAGYGLRFVTARPGAEQQAGDVRFRSYRMEHATGKLESFGYKVDVDGHTLSYTGDTALCQSVFDLGEGADVLVVDATHVHTESPDHMSIDDVREVRRRIGRETAIVLTHLEATPDVEGMDRTVVARDGATFLFA